MLVDKHPHDPDDLLVVVWQNAKLMLMRDTHSYQKYIAGLPFHRQNEIIDAVMHNTEKRTNSTDLVVNVNALSSVELETVAAITLQGTSHEGWEGVREALPPAIVKFRLLHPMGSS